MKKIVTGDIFKYSYNNKDYGIHVIGAHQTYGIVSRVTDLYGGGLTDVESLTELFCILLPVKQAVKSGDFEYIGRLPLPESRKGELRLRYPNVRLEGKSISGWTIVEDGFERRVKTLSDKEMNYPYAFWVDLKKLDELIDSGWNGKSLFPD